MLEVKQRVVKQMPSLKALELAKEKKKLRVCAYARVSTLSEEQEDSFERQVEYYTKYINANADWEMVKIYADQGTTGTRTDKRTEFNQMIKDCKNGGIDKILVKSISRFARNTVDTLTYIREMKEIGISIYFESEHLDTFAPGGEMLLTILAGLAEQESRSMSTNIKWAFQKKFKNGEVILGNLYGYKKLNNGEYVIVEEQANIVRRIYREYLCGFSINQIVDKLNEDNIPNKKGNKWIRSSVNRMLRNLKYTGNAVLGMTCKADVLSKKRVKNEGQSPQYMVENSHSAIIEKELYDLVQEELKQRRIVDYATEKGDGRYVSKYPFSGMIFCSNCNSRYRRLVRKKDDREYVTWVCSNRISNLDSKCEKVTLWQDKLEQAYLNAMKKLLESVADKAKIMDNITDSITDNTQAEILKLQAEIEEIYKRVVALHSSKRDGTTGSEKYHEEIKALTNVLENKEQELSKAKTLNAENILNEERKTRLMEIAKEETLLDKFDVAIMKSLVDKIVVKSQTTIEIRFKGGEIITENIQ